MRCAALLVCLLVVTTVAPSGVAATPPPEMETPTTEFHVHLQPDGDARWEVRMQFDLDSENETAAFRDYANRFEAGEATVGPDIAFFESAAASASQTADREMRITNVTRSSAIDAEAGTGVLRLQFVWTEFLAGGGDRYVLSDVLQTGEDSTWLASLEADQSLRIYRPEGYEIVESSIRARQVNESLIIDGATSYEADEFRIVYGRTGGAGPTSTTTTTGSPVGPTGPTGPTLGGVAFGTLLLVGLAVAAVWFWQRRDDDGEPTDRPGRPDDGAMATEATSEESSTAGTTAGANGSGPASPAPGIDPELLSDEERVERLLEHNGGRMRQAAIVTETDWSDAKVSQLLSRMADEGRVEKLRLGRENLISLPGADTRNGQRD